MNATDTRTHVNLIARCGTRLAEGRVEFVWTVNTTQSAPNARNADLCTIKIPICPSVIQIYANVSSYILDVVNLELIINEFV